MSTGVTMMNVRQGIDSQVFKVGGEMVDQQGYRVDVTVWFRHRNESLYYLDSGGNLHGPLDLKHSAKLDGMKKSSDSFMKRSWVESQRSKSTTRTDANYQTTDNRRSRTHSESRGHVSAEIDGLLDDLNKMKHQGTLGRTEMTRWSSLGTVGAADGEAGRYSTTLTRRHIKRSGGRAPVDVYVKQQPVMGSGLSKVDLLSVETPSNPHAAVNLHVDNRHAEDREQRLVDELIQTRRELQRTRSLMSEDGRRGLNYGSTLKVPVNSGSTRNIHIRTEGIPPRTFSQSNINQYSNTLRNQWTSENNLRSGTLPKQPPMYGTYSAHQENLRRQDLLNQQTENLRTSRRMSESGVGRVYQETVSLQPIGRGIQNLEGSSCVATLPRAGSHTGGRLSSVGAENRGQYYSGTQSPVISRAPGGRMVSEHRSRVVQNEWHNANGLGSSMGSLTPVQHQPNHLGVSQVDHQTTDLSNYWFRPHISREEATRALINKEPGHFIIRQSKSQANSYALVIRVPLTPGTTEQVRTFLLNRVKGGEAVHLQGFESEPIFPSLSSFVHDHTIHQGALPVPLKLPIRDAFSSGYLAGAGSDFACDVLYLGGVDVFPLKGESAVRRAVEQLLAQANNPQKGLKKMCEATVLCDNTKGITITDKHSTRFTKKRIPANKIIHCSYDPEERVFNTFELKNRGIFDSLIFAVVVKTSRFTWTEHVVYVMCQLEANQPSSKLINFINQNYIVQHRF